MLSWFDNNNVEFISAIPSCDMNAINYGEMFSKKSRGDLTMRILSQIAMLFSSLGAEGGLFLVIGKKR